MRKKLIERRKKRNITQAELANMLHKSRSTISCYESGKITPPYEVALEIKKILKYNNDSLFENEG